MKFSDCWVVLGTVLLGVSAAACSAASTPRPVASYPKTSVGGNPSSAAADGPTVVETVRLTLEVGDPNEAAAAAARMAVGYGGFESNRYAWQTVDGQIVSQELFVPLIREEDFRLRLLQMGWKDQESVVRNPNDAYGDGYGWAEFSIQYLPYRYDAGRNNTFKLQMGQAVCALLAGAASFLLRAAASLFVAIAVVIPCVWMVVGAVTTIRWLLRK